MIQTGFILRYGLPSAQSCPNGKILPSSFIIIQNRRSAQDESLFLGGTGTIVEVPPVKIRFALSQGWDITLMNSGATTPEMCLRTLQSLKVDCNDRWRPSAGP